MRFLFVMDPLKKLTLEWDTSLCLLRELAHRGHECWAADLPEIWAEGDLFASARKIRHRGGLRYQTSPAARWEVQDFDLVLIRKDPPFNEGYLYLTHLLEGVATKVPVVNHPRGIRNTNEKLILLRFPKWIPETLVTSDPERILEFQRKLGTDVIVKPCEEKGGAGIVLLKRSAKNAGHSAEQATQKGQRIRIAQRFLTGRGIRGDKRILLLGGEFLTAFERHIPKGGYRANLSLGGTFHPAKVTAREKVLIRELKPYLRREGLSFVGLDVMDEKLLEVNVTSPAGLVEAKILDPRSSVTATVAHFLERLARR